MSLSQFVVEVDEFFGVVVGGHGCCGFVSRVVQSKNPYALGCAGANCERCALASQEVLQK